MYGDIGSETSTLWTVRLYFFNEHVCKTPNRLNLKDVHV